MNTIPPVDRKIIKSELCKETLLRTTRNGENEIHVVNQQNAPNVLSVIGRLREVTFRSSGVGT